MKLPCQANIDGLQIWIAHAADPADAMLDVLTRAAEAVSRQLGGDA